MKIGGGVNFVNNNYSENVCLMQNYEYLLINKYLSTYVNKNIAYFIPKESEKNKR